MNLALSGAVGVVEACPLIVLRLLLRLTSFAQHPLRTKLFFYGVAPTKFSAYSASS